MNGVYRAVGLLVLVAVALAGGLLFAPGWSSEIWAAGALAATAVVVSEILLSMGALRRRSPSIFEAALSSWQPPTARPSDLEAIERALGWRSYSGPEYDHRVRPVLRRAAAARLGSAPPPDQLAALMSDVPTSDTVRTPQIAASVAEIEGL